MTLAVDLTMKVMCFSYRNTNSTRLEEKPVFKLTLKMLLFAYSLQNNMKMKPVISVVEINTFFIVTLNI